MPAATLRTVTLEQADGLVAEGACYIDLRPTDDYLEVHIPGSLGLVYEFGPGMASRARDCLPLDVSLVLLEAANADPFNAAAALRGKGFTVLGLLEDGINRWVSEHGAPSSTEVVEGPYPPDALVLDVSDPGRILDNGGTRISIEHLWARASELAGEARVAVAAGYGVRAGLAVGMLERAGVEEVLFWKTRAPAPRRLEPYG